MTDDRTVFATMAEAVAYEKRKSRLAQLQHIIEETDSRAVASILSDDGDALALAEALLDSQAFAQFCVEVHEEATKREVTEPKPRKRKMRCVEVLTTTQPLNPPPSY